MNGHLETLILATLAYWAIVPLLVLGWGWLTQRSHGAPDSGTYAMPSMDMKAMAVVLTFFYAATVLVPIGASMLPGHYTAPPQDICRDHVC